MQYILKLHKYERNRKSRIWVVFRMVNRARLHQPTLFRVLEKSSPISPLVLCLWFRKTTYFSKCNCRDCTKLRSVTVTERYFSFILYGKVQKAMESPVRRRSLVHSGEGVHQPCLDKSSQGRTEDSHFARHEVGDFWRSRGVALSHPILFLFLQGFTLIHMNVLSHEECI